MNAKDIKKAAKQYAADMMDDSAVTTDWNPENDSERSMYLSEYDMDMELSLIVAEAK
jgi:hypothetical protein